MRTECSNCGYEWDYSGSLEQATCPNCGKKTETGSTEAEA